MYNARFIVICYAHVVACCTQLRAIREGVVMRGSHGVCDCDILRRANVYKSGPLPVAGGGGGGSSEPSEPPLGTGMKYVAVRHSVAEALVDRSLPQIMYY